MILIALNLCEQSPDTVCFGSLKQVTQLDFLTINLMFKKLFSFSLLMIILLFYIFGLVLFNDCSLVQHDTF